MIAANIRARIFEIEEVRTWERNPQVYADILATSLADAGDLPLRARGRAGPPRPLEAAADAAADPGRARQHQGAAGHLRQGRPRDAARRAEVHRAGPAAGVLGRRRPAPARRPGRRVDRGRRRAQGLHPATSRQELAPRARASFRLGRERFEQKLKLDEGIGARRRTSCWRSPTRELWTRAGGVPARGRRAWTAATRSTTWRRIKAEHPAPGELVRRGAAAARASCATFIERHDLVTMPPGEPLVVAPTPEFYRWTFREPVDAGPVRDQADARLLLPDRRRPVVAGRAAGRAPARLQLRDALVDLDPRGLPGPLPALPAPAAGRVEAAEVDPVLARRPPSRAGRTTASR